MDKRRRQYLNKIQEKFNYKFENLDILNEAIDRTKLSDSYEFFGDIALYGAASEYMIKKYTQLSRYNLEWDYGGIETLNVKQLSDIKSKLTSNSTFAIIIRKLDLVADMPLSEEDERNGLRNNNHRLGDLYERIIGAIAIESFHSRYSTDLKKISDIYSSHIDLIYRSLDLPEFTESELGSDFTTEVVLKRDELFSDNVDDISHLKRLSDRKKIPPITYEFTMERGGDNTIIHLCLAKFPKDSTVDLKRTMHPTYSEPFVDIYQWPSKLFVSKGKGKSKNEAKAIAAHCLLNKIKARYDAIFILEENYMEEGMSVEEINNREVIHPTHKRLTKNVEISDRLLDKYIK